MLIYYSGLGGIPAHYCAKTLTESSKEAAQRTPHGQLIRWGKDLQACYSLHYLYDGNILSRALGGMLALTGYQGQITMINCNSVIPSLYRFIYFFAPSLAKNMICAYLQRNMKLIDTYSTSSKIGLS